MNKYFITAQNKSGAWKDRQFNTLKELIDCFQYWKALQYPYIKIQRRVD